MNDWWTPAGLIEERIRTLLPVGWEVQQVASLSAVLRFSEFDRVVFVAPIGSPRTDSSAQGRVATVAQKYAVVFAVRAQGDDTGEERRAAAGPVIATIVPRLMGWSPGHGWTTLEITSAPAADYVAAEFAYYPFAFETSIELRAVK